MHHTSSNPTEHNKNKIKQWGKSKSEGEPGHPTDSAKGAALKYRLQSVIVSHGDSRDVWVMVMIIIVVGGRKPLD